MGRLAWPLRPLPDGRGEVWRWDLATVAELPAARAGLRSRLGDVGFPRDGENTAGERLVLAFDELASNALRHGESPVVATVVAGSGGWLLDVSDRAPRDDARAGGRPRPRPGRAGAAPGRPASVAHGWYVDGGGQARWACLPTTVEEPTRAWLRTVRPEPRSLRRPRCRVPEDRCRGARRRASSPQPGGSQWPGRGVVPSGPRRGPRGMTVVLSSGGNGSWPRCVRRTTGHGRTSERRPCRSRAPRGPGRAG